MNKDIYLLRATECASIASFKFIGQKKKNIIDEAAVQAMQMVLNNPYFRYRVVSGEGVLDEAPMLYDNQILGSLNKEAIELDLVVDPIEGTKAAAYNYAGSVSTIAATLRNQMRYLPEMYMEKLFVAREFQHVIDLTKSLAWNIQSMKKVKKDNLLRVIILDKPRHQEVIQQLNNMNVLVRTIADGDVLAAIDVVNKYADFVYGIGGAPEGLLMASLAIAANCKMQCRLIPYNQVWPHEPETKQRLLIEKSQLAKHNFAYQTVYNDHDLISDPTTRFFATGVTAGGSLKPIYIKNNAYYLHSFIASYGVIRNIMTVYDIQALKNINININDVLQQYARPF